MKHHFDCVVSYHHNIHTCGVARFNKYLSDFLEVPMVYANQLEEGAYKNGLISLKRSEMLDGDLSGFLLQISRLKHYSMILHDFSGSSFESDLLSKADRVMVLNDELADRVRSLRRDVVVGFTVASYEYVPSSSSPDLRLITFGMAHKIQATGYSRVGELLNSDTRTFVLEISSALHEGTEFDDSFFMVGREISECFEGKVEFLGFLADVEVARRVAQASAMLAFFPRGARENNNSVMSAMRLGVPVITNLDDRSPRWLKHDRTVFDVNRLDAFPKADDLWRVGLNGKRAVESLTYDRLVNVLLNS